MLTLIGIGLCDGKDITLRGKEAVDNAQQVYIESYTSLLQCTHEELEKQLGRTIQKLDRKAVEVDIDKILRDAKQTSVVILIIGDVFGATTHTDLYLRARQANIDVRVIHNASIINAVGAVGLELYRYGKTVSVPYWMPGFEPTSFLDGIKENKDRGLHTLCLLDIKADEGRFMSVAEGLHQLLKANVAREFGKEQDTTRSIITDDLLVVGVARAGCADQIFFSGRAQDIAKRAFGAPPHCIIIPGKLHPIEEEMLALWK